MCVLELVCFTEHKRRLFFFFVCSGHAAAVREKRRGQFRHFLQLCWGAESNFQE